MIWSLAQVRLPIFGWYTSKGECLEGKGILPHVIVEVDPALRNSGIDQQMNKAIEILNGVGASLGLPASRIVEHDQG